MEKIDYGKGLHTNYARGRALPIHSIERWLDAFEDYLPSRRPLALVDVGCGTGRFTPGLAARFGGPVVGVEPSDAMRGRAEAEATGPHVEYRAGSAEALPLDSDCCDGALLFFVWHHVDDRRRAAAELRRVVRDDGVLLIRTQLSDAMPDMWWYAYSDAARRIDAAMYLPKATLREEIEAEGWSFVGLTRVPYEVAPSKAAYADRLRLRALSTFEHMTTDELEALFTALDNAELDDREPVLEVGTLLAWQAE